MEREGRSNYLNCYSVETKKVVRVINKFHWFIISVRYTNECALIRLSQKKKKLSFDLFSGSSWRRISNTQASFLDNRRRHVTNISLNLTCSREPCLSSSCPVSQSGCNGHGSSSNQSHSLEWLAGEKNLWPTFPSSNLIPIPFLARTKKIPNY